MQLLKVLCAVSAAWWACTAVLAGEGSSIAGPIGGNDIRSAQLPPPGLYGGAIALYAEAHQFFDGDGKLVPALSGLDLERTRMAPFLLYVPDIKVLGGSIGIAAALPGGTECGRLFETTPRRCISGVGDPYVEVVWSRYFGTLRPSQYPDAFPIAEGLTVALGIGVVIPVGRYSAADAASHGLTIGNNIWDFAPTAAFTYVTKPVLADGTEISVKAYWNNYLRNPDTGYATGSLINIDFAISEKIGRFQVGIAGYYAFQIEDDDLHGLPVAADGQRGRALTLGPVIAYDMPEFGASIKIKFLATEITHNTVASTGGGITWVQRF